MRKITRLSLCLAGTLALASILLLPAGKAATSGRAPFGDSAAITTTTDDDWSVHAADMSGDGDTDQTIHHGAIFPPQGQVVIVDTADYARSVYTADLDGDGDLDVLSASEHDDKIAWYENEGGAYPTFISHVITDTADFAKSVHAADVDGDGDLDVLSASWNDDKIAWYENDGGSHPTFASHIITTFADSARSVYAADVDGDGDIDVLSASWEDDKIAWYENDGGAHPTFTSHIVTGAADAAISVYAADVDGDGDMDVLSASANDDKVAWYENDGEPSPTFSSHTITTTANLAQAVYAADVDGDGDVDVLSASRGDDKIAWYENDGSLSPTFISHVITNTAGGAKSVYAADVDGDGDMDVLSTSYGDNEVTWYENDGTRPPAFTSHVITTNVSKPAEVHTADVDGDGDMDVLSASQEDSMIAWYPNQAIHRSAIFPPQGQAVITNTADYARSVYTADVDGDGDLDVLSASENDDKIVWYENEGGAYPTFISHVITDTADLAKSVYAADVDGDGDVDVLSASWNDDKIAWYENDGGLPPTFTSHIITTAADSARSVYAADVDGDGDIDVLSASWEDDRVAWYENDGGAHPTFTSHIVTDAADGANLVYAADVDGDGDTDVLSASANDDKVAWYENDGEPSPTFSSHTITTTADLAQAVYAADMDGDGDVDVLSASRGDNKIAWYENDGSPSPAFISHIITDIAGGTKSVYAADVDGDGDMDVLSASREDDKIAWYENDGARPPAFTSHVITTNTSQAVEVHAADVDGDGDIDVLSASQKDDKIAWYENRGGQFALATSDTAPATLNAGQMDDMLRIVATHQGRAGDTDAELVTLELLFEEDAGDPLTTAEANALIENLRVYRDDGSGVFEGGTDTLVTTLSTLALSAGTQTITFADGAPAARVTFSEPVTYFVAVELTGDAPNQTPHQFRATHVTSGSTAQDRDHDLALTLEFAPNVASGFCTAIAPIPPTGVVINGPLTGSVNVAHTFTATVSPLTASQPITYAWQATGQSPVTHTNGLSDTINFSWSESGTHTITATASNAYGTVLDTHTITISLPPEAVPVAGVTINGPLTGDVNVAHTFSAAVSPLTATQPITYAWQATAQSPVTHTNGLSDTINFIWSESGTHTITATASNAYGMVTDTHTITISLPPEAVPVAGVTINGPLAGDVNVAHTFSAAVSPLTATQPITYAWQATGQSPVTHTGGLSDTVSFIWSASDTQAIIVTASNAYSAVTSIHTITLDPPVDGDAYELDDSCAQARSIPTDDAVQVHTFHDEGDGDWVKFQAQAGKTFVIKVDNVGADVDAVIMLYDACGDAPVDYGDNAFGRTVRMEWDCAVDGEYYLKLMQHDPSVYGEDTYDLSVAADAEPPSAPRSVRATPAHEALVVQWQRSPERDAAGYIVRWGTHPGGPYSGVDGVDGADSTYYRIADLTNGIAYYIVVQAWDFSDNESGHSWEIGDIPVPNPDATQPSIAINRPSAEPVYTTTVDNLTIRGDCADSGDNLSRVWVRNVTNGAEGWDYSLSGKSDVFDVESVPLVIGDNQIEVTVYDAVGNTGSAALTIHRLAGQNGAVVIVGGHDESYRLQTRIDYATRRAYNVFRGAGFGPEDIYYLSPTPQDADGDGFDDVTSTPAPANVHAALRWAADRVGPGVPFFLYMMDHGQIEGFCADGCAPAGQITSQDLDAWLSELEASSGGDQVNVIIEACHSGSFVDRAQGIAKSISRNGRVVIASTGRTNLAYASAQGAYFSDAFFSAVANSNSLLDSFDHAKTAIEVTGNDQTPWLDDNGDGLYTPADGAFAAERYVASFFGSLLPRITETSISRSGAKGTITARVERGDGPMDLVWAVVYAPSFHEPISNTMELGVPLIKLEPDEEQEEVYVANYNGFIEEGIYRVVIYAADDAGNQALPKRVLMEKVFLPLALKDHVSASPTRSSGDGEVLFGSKSVITTIPASPPWLQYTLPKEPTLERPRLSRFEPGPRRRWDDQWHK